MGVSISRIPAKSEVVVYISDEGDYYISKKKKNPKSKI